MKPDLSGAQRPPIVLLGVVLLVVRGLSLLLGQLAGPESPAISILILSQCYFAGEAALIVGLALVAWKCFPWLRVIMSLLVTILIPSLIFVGMIDLFLFLITGDHLTPSVLRQFVGPRLFRSSNFWEAVRSYGWPIGLALFAVLTSYVIAFRFFWKRGR